MHRKWGSTEDIAATITRTDVVHPRWMSGNSIPKLFIDAEPAGFLIGAQREFCRSWPNQLTVTVDGVHFLPEDAPEDTGKAMARFVADVRAGHIA